MKSSPTTNPILPTDEWSEKAVLGALVLYGGEVMDTLRPVIEPDDFSSQKHRDVWGACCACYDAGDPISAASVFYRLREIGKHESVGISYLGDICEGAVPSISREVERLKSATHSRRIMTLCDAAMRRSACEDAREVQDWLMEQLSGLTETGVKVESTRDLVDRIGIDEIVCPSRSRGGLRLPWPKMQNALNGLRAGQLVVVAAYTSRGKSSLACQIAAHATRQATGVYYWSTEMAPEALFRRMIDQMGVIDGIRHRDAALTRDEIGRAKDAVMWLYDHPIWFDAQSRTVTSALANLRHVQAKHDIGLVVVDHLQHVRSAGRYDSRAREVSEISRSLKMAALDLGLPILVVSQVSRPKEDDKPLSIHMLKESGDVENDADAILLLNSPKPAGVSPVTVSVNVAKQREGPAGFDIPLLFRPSTQSFESMED